MRRQRHATITDQPQWSFSSFLYKYTFLSAFCPKCDLLLSIKENFMISSVFVENGFLESQIIIIIIVIIVVVVVVYRRNQGEK